MSNLSDAIAAGRFAITAEITPPLSADPADLLSKASVLKGHVDAANVTDGASARAHMSSVAAAGLLVQHGIEPVLQFTCRDRNRIALQSDILGGAALGVENLLILRGDDPSAGDQPDAKPVFDYESRDLMDCARQMRDDATLPSGREIKSAPKLFIGGADTPMDPADERWKPDGLLAKIGAGAGFFQTQFCFDADMVRKYAAGLIDHGISERAGVLIGIGPLASAKSARWMRENLWGTTIPDALIDRLDAAADPKAEGTAICAELIAAYADIEGIAGVHLMAPLGVDAVPLAIEQSGVRH
ncbi:MAG: methylenetetrahydrofolate reductase (NADPH) [Paracoccaceae bacterium]|jgi:methylenetetrahydrofolate reductase (NADPH)